MRDHNVQEYLLIQVLERDLVGPFEFSHPTTLVYVRDHNVQGDLLTLWQYDG
jgi:hypothetical protein